MGSDTDTNVPAEGVPTPPSRENAPSTLSEQVIISNDITNAANNDQQMMHDEGRGNSPEAMTSEHETKIEKAERSKETTGKGKREFSKTESVKRTHETMVDTSSQDIKDKLVSVWSEARDDSGVDKAIRFTLSIVNTEIDSLVQSGLESFQQCDRIANEYELLKEHMKGMELELKRVRTAEAKGRETISVSPRRKTFSEDINDIFLDLDD